VADDAQPADACRDRGVPQRWLRASEQLLRRAFVWFRGKVNDSYRYGQELARFLDTLSDRLFFTVITVTDELNAFKVFETLNSRGVRLSPIDLLKNYLFSVVARETGHAHDIDTLERRWDDVVQVLGGDSLPDFLRAHWNSRRRFVRVGAADGGRHRPLRRIVAAGGSVMGQGRSPLRSTHCVISACASPGRC
jgi:hypothetical protein